MPVSPVFNLSWCSSTNTEAGLVFQDAPAHASLEASLLALIAIAREPGFMFGQVLSPAGKVLVNQAPVTPELESETAWPGSKFNDEPECRPLINRAQEPKPMTSLETLELSIKGCPVCKGDSEYKRFREDALFKIHIACVKCGIQTQTLAFDVKPTDTHPAYQALANMWNNRV